MEIKQGYEDERFPSAVPHNFHCVICFDVLKQPMQCVRNEHSFCKPCIIRYLQEHERCPTCMEPLTLQTLRPSRVITDLISQLNIKCDHFERGCPYIMKLEMLEAHITNCELSLVKCSNDGCEVIVNRKDQLHHENIECDYSKEKCVVCGKDVPRAKRLLHCYVNEIKEEISGMKEMMMNLSRNLTRRMEEMNRQVTDLKTQMGYVKPEIEKEVKSLKQAPQSFFRSLCSAVSCLEQNVNTMNDVIIAGGFDPEKSKNSVELFSWATRQWTLLPAMTLGRWLLSPFIHRGQVFVCGGLGSRGSMEVLQFGKDAKQWKNFPAKIPNAPYGHTSVVYGNTLFIFGGFQSGYAVYQLSLVCPYSSRLVCHLSEPRMLHGTQRFEDKFVIVGGTTTGRANDSVDTAFVYDITNNCCQTLAPLPFAVSHMATVTWKDNIITIGGRDKNDNELNTVVSYNIKEEKSKALPLMKHKRSDCTAVVTENVIVVMGGRNREEGDLNFVECFNFYNYVWEELPPRNM